MRQIYFYIIGTVFLTILLGCDGPSGVELKRSTQTGLDSSTDSEESEELSSKSSKSGKKNKSSESSESSESGSDPESSESGGPVISPSNEEEDEEDEVSNIKICIFYARDLVQLVNYECNCHHCNKGSLSLFMNNIPSPVSYSVKNWSSTRMVDLIKGGQRKVGEEDHFGHSHNFNIVDGYHKSDIPGQVYTGGEVDESGNFKIKVEWNDEPTQLYDCQAFNNTNQKCGVNSRGKMDQILYSVIGQVGDKYFKQNARTLRIGSVDTIRKQDIKGQLSNVEFQFGNWCEIEDN